MTHTRIPGLTLPSWPLAQKLDQTAALTANPSVDVCVVGAGLAGMTTAYLLACDGHSVAVVDKGLVGGGNTGRTTAQLASALDDRYSELVRIQGEEKARLAAQSHSAAIDMVEAIVHDEGIACDFERVDGYLFAGHGGSREVLDEELKAAHEVGLATVRRVERAPLSDFDTGYCLRFPDQGQFDPLAYLSGLTEAFRRRGGQIYTDTPVDQVQDGQPAKVQTRGGFTVTTGAVVVATNSPINDKVALHTKQAPYTTYVVALEVPAGSITKALYWDAEDPYHYVRLQTQDNGSVELLLVGGEDHKTGQADDAELRYSQLTAWARERFPNADEVAYRWSGQVYESLDGLAYIGRNPGDESIYVVTGDSGMGMTHGTIAGMLLRDLIVGRENPWAEIYDPSRKPSKAAGDFASENLNVAAQFTALVTSGEGKADDLSAGAGKIVGFGPNKRAVYRDEVGTLYTYSAICPHLGCVVAWNGGEKTWDCPCHGSRFDAFGKVLNGPAKADLKKVAKELP
jgi:glycine/D-amino acid oxidase-like deaminating enzyme/nitrite reductase/ring-hydroxylating ferredoxin subunit